MTQRIRELAKNKGWSISYLARQMGVNKGYFNTIEAKGLSVPEERIVQIAELLETTPDYLLGKTDDPTIPGAVTESQKEAMKLFRQLSDEDAAVVLKLLKNLVER